MSQQLKNQVQRNFREFLGEELFRYLWDASVTEIRCNEDGSLWVDGYAGKRKVGQVKPQEAMGVLSIIASTLQTTITKDQPSLAGEMYLVDGDKKCRYRVQGFIPPVTASPVYIIRKPATVIYSLDDYLDNEMMSRAHYDAIKNAVQLRQNILVAGGTGSGKTTLCNAILAEIACHFPDDRIILIEDTQELQCNVQDMQPLRACDARPIAALVRDALRSSPDRIVVGEVRGAEAYLMLKAWNTGHDGGVCTVHANDAREALQRIEDLVQEAGVVPAPRVIANTIHVVVWVAKDKSHPKGRAVREVVRVIGYDAASGSYVLSS
jgi:type IV secretion system protein TrbB